MSGSRRASCPAIHSALRANSSSVQRRWPGFIARPGTCRLYRLNVATLKCSRSTAAHADPTPGRLRSPLRRLAALAARLRGSRSRELALRGGGAHEHEEGVAVVVRLPPPRIAPPGGGLARR